MNQAKYTVAVALLLLVGGAQAASDDVWDISQGALVTNHSATISLSELASDMFGTSSGIEGSQLLFRDYVPAGTIHWVEWQTPAVVAIGTFNLLAAHDGHRFNPAGQCDLSTGFRDAQHRGFDHFTLKAWDGAGFNIVLYDQNILLGNDNAVHPGEDAQLYDAGGLISVYSNLLDLTVDIPPFATNRWRAEFRQVGCPSNESGPRIIELDGYPFDDDDGDSVSDSFDLCPGTTIPEGTPTEVLGINRWALTGIDGVFETTPPPGGGEGPALELTIEDTAGCSCEQIAEILELGKAHLQRGCSVEAMESFVELVTP